VTEARSVHRLPGALLLILVCLPTLAHDLPYTLATLEVHGRRFELTLNCHVTALILGLPQGLLPAWARQAFDAMPGEEAQRRASLMSEYLRRAVWVEADGRVLSLEAPLMPSLEALRADAAQTAETQRPSAPIRFKGELPAGARNLRLAIPPVLGDVLLRSGGESRDVATQALAPGAWSEPIERAIVPGEATGSRATAVQYLRLGYTHVLPLGLDHLLFILALALAAGRAGRLILEVTTFTLAHSLTLALTVLGLVEAPARVVETLIAASIVAMAVGNLADGRLRAHRTPLIFGFGLLHGLGFGGVLRELGLPQGQTVLALASFNIGIELAQLTALLPVIAASRVGSAKPWYRRWLVVPASTSIACVAGIWTLQRACC
jgi:hydrogenase/urease accessory protein HupE